MPEPVRYEGIHCTLELLRPAAHVTVVRFSGRDVGELRDAPLRALAEDLQREPLRLFLDARDSQGWAVDVSDAWARWLRQHRERLAAVTMLTSTRFMRLTAEQVRRSAELGPRMSLTEDAAAFDAALAAATSQA